MLPQFQRRFEQLHIAPFGFLYVNWVPICQEQFQLQLSYYYVLWAIYSHNKLEICREPVKAFMANNGTTKLSETVSRHAKIL